MLMLYRPLISSSSRSVTLEIKKPEWKTKCGTYIYTMESYSALKKEKKRTHLPKVMLTAVSHAQKSKMESQSSFYLHFYND